MSTTNCVQATTVAQALGAAEELMGRTRKKHVARYKSGQIKQEDVRLVAEWPRIRELAQVKSLDPRLGSPLGRLYFHRVITTPAFEAGVMFETLVRQHNAVIGIRMATPRAQALGQVTGGDPGEDSKETIRKAKRLKRRVAVIRDAVGPLWGVLNRVIIEENSPTPREKDRLETALAMLVLHWGLNRERKK